jgi:hypothetical protein
MVLVLIIQLQQQHVVTVYCFADATLEVVHLKCRHFLAGVTSSADDVELGQQGLPREEMD